MDIIDVYIIIGKGYNKDKVIGELKEEGYKHNFFFGNDFDLKTKRKHMEVASEVWTFGEAETLIDHRIALDMGKDIWKMG